MARLARLGLVALMLGLIVPAFAFDTARFEQVLKAAANADECLYSLMEPGLSKTSPEFQAALAAQKQARATLGQEITALDDKVSIEKALDVARNFSSTGAYQQQIGRLAEALLAKRLEFVQAHGG